MAFGMGFVDILVSEVTAVIAVCVFLFCAAALIFKRKTMSSFQKRVVLAAWIITGLYLAFVVFLALRWGQQIPQPTPQPML